MAAPGSEGLDPVSIGKVPQTCDKFKLLATMCQFDKLAANAKQLPGGRPGPPGRAAPNSAGRSGWSDGLVAAAPPPPSPQQWAPSMAAVAKVRCWLLIAASLLASLVALT
eukprot:gene13047-13174_t